MVQPRGRTQWPICCCDAASREFALLMNPLGASSARRRRNSMQTNRPTADDKSKSKNKNNKRAEQFHLQANWLKSSRRRFTQLFSSRNFASTTTTAERVHLLRAHIGEADPRTTS